MYSDTVQVFVLELYSGDSAIPRYNLSAESPYFFLQDLEPDVLFRAVVFAVNSKGRSPGVVLEELTFRDPEKRTSNTFVFFNVVLGSNWMMVPRKCI